MARTPKIALKVIAHKFTVVETGGDLGRKFNADKAAINILSETLNARETAAPMLASVLYTCHKSIDYYRDLLKGYPEKSPFREMFDNVAAWQKEQKSGFLGALPLSRDFSRAAIAVHIVNMQWETAGLRGALLTPQLLKFSPGELFEGASLGEEIDRHYLKKAEAPRLDARHNEAFMDYCQALDQYKDRYEAERRQPKALTPGA